MAAHAASGAHLLALRAPRLAAPASRANRSARGSSRRWSRAGRSISPIAPRPSSTSTLDAFQQAAGLIAYYNRTKFHCLAVGWDENAGRSLTILSCEGDYPEGRLSFPLELPIPLRGEGPVRLAVSVDHASLQFAYALDGEWRRVGPVLDASILSDEAGGGEHRSFTGAFVGMVAFDASGGDISADFRSFDYEGRAP